MIDLDEGFWQWVSLGVLSVNTIVALTISIRAGKLQYQVYELEGKIDLMRQIMFDTGKEIDSGD